MGRYRRRPTYATAIQFTGDNWGEMQDFCGERKVFGEEHWIPTFNPIGTYLIQGGPDQKGELWVAANQSWLPLVPGEWVIQDELGFYPCKDDRFLATYEAI